MPLRPRNPSGFVRPRQTTTGRRWQGIIQYPDPDRPGKWKQRSASFDRRAEAQIWVDSALAEHRKRPEYRPPTDLTVSAYLDQWLTAVSGRLRPTTMRSYRQMAGYVRAALGQQSLSRVTPLDLQRLYSSLTERGLSPRTVQYVHAVTTHALKDAEDWDLIHSNPARRAKPPRVLPGELQVPTPREAAHLIRVAEGDRLCALWTWLALTGTRHGEALGLRWADLDLDAGVAAIRRTLTNPGAEAGPPKTQQGTRTISLSPHLVKVLSTQRHDQMLDRLAAGEAWQDTGHVFTTRRGTPFGQRNVAREFKALLRKAGLPERFRIHDLRHAMATHWLARGIPAKVVSERLGHSSVAFTLQRYGHVLPNQQASAAAAMEQDLLGSVSTPSAGGRRNSDFW